MEPEQLARLKTNEFIQKFKNKNLVGYAYTRRILEVILKQYYTIGYADVKSLRQYREALFSSEISYINLSKNTKLFIEKEGFEGTYKGFLTQCLEEIINDPLLNADSKGDELF